MKSLLGLNREQLAVLDPKDVTWILSTDEVIHVLATLQLFWMHDPVAASRGKLGLHAQLRSGRCSNGFANVREMLKKYPNLRRIMAGQMVARWMVLNIRRPDFVAGIPDAATELGEDFAKLLGVRYLKLVKQDGKIVLNDELLGDELGQLLDDVYSSGTGYKEGAAAIFAAYPNVKLAPHDLTVLKRGEPDAFEVPGMGKVVVVGVAERIIHEYNPPEWVLEIDKLDKEKIWVPGLKICPHCQADIGTKRRIKPKDAEHPENWGLLTTSQD